MAKRKTHEEFVQELQYYFGSEFTLKGQFTGSRKPHTFVHKCGKEIEVAQPHKMFYRGLTCPCCKFNISTKEDILFYLKDYYNNEYRIKMSSKDISLKSEILVTHRVCGKQYKSTIKDFFFKKDVCKECDKETYSMSSKKFAQQIKEQVGNEYELICGNVTSMETHGIVRHNTCGHEYKVTPNTFLYKNRRCPVCSAKRAGEKQKLNYKDIEKRLMKVHPNIEVLSEYKGVHEKIMVRDSICNHSWSATPHNLEAGFYCPICKTSKGEKRIAQFLSENNFPYKQEFSFDDCKYKRPLRFDFLVSVNGKMHLIEYNGIQHYEEIEFFKGTSLEENQKRDQIKVDYCKKNYIPLLIIPYYEDNIEEQLKNFLK